MSARKPATSIILTQPQIEWVRAEAARLGISQSDVIRRVLDDRRGWPAPQRLPKAEGTEALDAAVGGFFSAVRDYDKNR